MRRATIEGLPALRRELERGDPASAARIGPGDTYRTVRALAVLAATGRPASAFGIAHPEPHRLAVLGRPRDVLLKRIGARCAAMLEGGALREARALRRRGLDPSSPILRAIGMPHLLALLEGRITKADALAHMTRDTARYAKRQVTWFRHRPGAVFVDATNAARASALLVRLARAA